MNMKNWAEKEVEIACKRERSGNETSEEEWDYGCACYESALKAFESLLEDGHSGFSIGLTQNILNRLIDGKVLTPIEDTPDIWNEPDDYREGYKIYQCKRMSSLFKDVYDDGTIKYTDVDRYVGIPIENPRCCYTNGRIRDIVNELFPITIPYYPESKRYEIYTDNFLYDEDNGDFDCEAFYYMITPSGERIELNRFYYYPGENITMKITKEQYEEMKTKRKK